MSEEALQILRRLAAELLDVAPAAIDPDANIFAAGLDSLRVFRLSTALRREGYQVTLAACHAGATLSDWAASARRISRQPKAARRDAGETPQQLKPIQAAYLAGRQGNGPFSSGSHHYFEFDGAVDHRKLEQAVAAIVARHSALRLRITPDGQQHIADEARAGVVLHDLRRLTAIEQDLQLSALRRKGNMQPLDIENGECLSVELALLPGGATRTMLKVDMIACDAAGFRVLVSDLTAAMDHSIEPLDSARCRSASRAPRGQQDADRTSGWRARLENIALAPALPCGGTGLHGAQPMIRRRSFLAPAERTLLEALSRKRGLTATAICAAIYCDILAEFSVGEDFVVILPVMDEDVGQGVVGNRTLALPLIWRGSHGSSLGSKAHGIVDALLQDRTDADYTTTQLWRDLAAEGRGVSPRAVFTSMIGMGDLIPETAVTALGTVVWVASETPDVGIDLQLYEGASGIHITVEGREAFVAAPVLDKIAMLFETCLRAVLTDPDSLDRPRERKPRVLRGPARAISDDRLDDALRRSGRGPRASAPALLDPRGGTKACYGDLLDQAMRVSGGLIARGVKPGDHVALALSDTDNEVAAACGCLLAGAAYVPIRADAPAAMVADMARIAAPRLCIVDDGSATIFDGLLGGGIDLWPLARLAETAPHAAEDGGNGARAYVLFTSGSTGAPKAVAVSHRAAINTIDSLCSMPGLTAGDGLLGLSDLTFDLAVFDIFAALRAGARLSRVPREARTDPARWAAIVADGALTIWQSAPQFLELALWKPDPGLGSLRHVLLGGDIVRPDLLRRLRGVAAEARLWALGGATEAAIHSTLYEITDPDEPAPAPFGAPLTNVSLRVVDRAGHDRVEGVPGELWIGGASCAEGYLGDPDRTAQQFPSRDGQRWYRTGDRAFIDDAGCVHFIGRLDRRVKIAGQLVDLAGIETTLMGIPGIDEAVAIHRPEYGLQAALKTTLSEDALDRAFAQSLPTVQRPAKLLCLDRFPVTANGKIDRAAIASMLQAEPPPERPAQTGTMRTIVLDVASAVLGRPITDGSARFYALGGNSLQAIDLIRRLDERGVSAPGALELIATAPLDALADGARRAIPSQSVPIRSNRLTPVQEAYRLGRGDLFEYGRLAPLWYWEFETARADVQRLSMALAELVAAHSCLRHRIGPNGTCIADPPPLEARIVVMEQQDQTGPDIFCRKVMDALDGEALPPHVSAGVLHGTDSDRIGVAFDIMFVDARSIAAAMEEIGARYSGQPLRAPIPAPALVMSSTDRTMAQQRWADRLHRLPAQPGLPVHSGNRPHFARRSLLIEIDAWKRLESLAAKSAITPTVLIASLYADVLLRWSADEALALNVTLFEPPAPEDEPLGEHTRLIPVFVEVGAATLAALGVALGREMAAAVDGAAYGSIDVMRDMTRARGTGHAILPFVLTSTLGLDIGRVLYHSGLGRYAGGISQTPQTWIDCQVMEATDGLHVNWDVLDSAFPTGLADAMFHGFKTLLMRLAQDPSLWSRPAGRKLPGQTLFAAPRAPLPGKGLHGPIFACAEDKPDAIALLPDRGAPIRYGELATRALTLGARLRDRSVKRGARVGILTANRQDQIVAALAIHAAGAAYVPLNPAWPQQRLAEIIETAGMQLILADIRAPATIGGARCIGITDSFKARLDRPDVPNPDQTAYVIFTSGTTGAAKGVTMSHAAARNTIDALRVDLALGSDDCLLVVSPFDFDLSVFDVFGVLGAGGRLALPRIEGKLAPASWAAAMKRHRVTIWNSAPSLFAMALDATPGGTDAPIRHVLLSGDRIPPDMPTRTATWAPSAILTALGGATEAGIWSNAWRGTTLPSDWSTVPYGYSLAGQKHRVVAEDGSPQPFWAPGELWIGGDSLAKGYENDPDRSASTFPESDGGRWYRTGDQARVRSDGLIEFMGRIDLAMGKVNGVRIDCEEVGAALASLPGIADALALIDPGPPPRLLGFVRPEPGAAPDPSDRRERLAKTLPAGFIPSKIVSIDAWPSTPNGKLDRASLLAATQGSDRSATVPWQPVGHIDHWVEEIWSRLLKTDSRAGRSFLQDGGDSLIALEMIEAIENAFGFSLPLRTLFFEARAADVAREVGARCRQRDREMETGEI